MTYDALTFTLTSPRTGRLVGVGLVCLEARYASVLWTRNERIDRRAAAPAEWQEVALEFQLEWQPGPIPAATTVARLLAGDRLTSTTVLLHSGESVMAERPELLVWTLDQKLRELAERSAIAGVDDDRA